jgi:DNA (cytosine-5)-methyltransferase 1
MTQRYISVYSGAGGFDLGLIRAGFSPGLMAEESQPAWTVLKAAMPSSAVLNADIHDLLNAGTFAAVSAKAPPVLVAGQPPLLSSPSPGSAVDPEGDAPQLLYRFLDVVAQARPAAFAMVSLPFLNSPRWGGVLSRLRRISRDLGYDTFTPVLDAAEYGVPQHRDRLFFLGMPHGCKPDAAAVFRSPDRVSAGTALRALHQAPVRDIPCPAGVRLSPVPVLRNSPYAGALLAGPGRVVDLRKTAPVLPAAIGGNKTPVIDMRQLESGEDPWIEGYHDYLWRLNGVPGSYGSESEGERRMRRLSLRECAALQGFPADYPFRGAPLVQFRMTGAAVPPALGEAVGRSVEAGLA